MEKQSQIIIKKLGKFELDNVYCGDSKELTKDLPDNSIDLILTDPPYQLDSISKRWGKDGKNVMQFDKSPHHRTIRGFMGKEWDVLPPIEVWQESLRILKPGAFAFIMTTPRQDSLCQILMDLTNAGFNMGFSSIYWTYASGFPKASNIGKMVDKRECKKQLTEKLGRKPTKEEFKKAWKRFREIIKKEIKANSTFHTQNVGGKIKGKSEVLHTKGTSELEGSYAGFQPKPAVEVIIVAMKPLSEKTYVDQALKNKHGITWLDDGRIPYESEGTVASNPKLRVERGYKTKTGDRIFCQGELGKKNTMISNVKTGGRFPANLIVSDDVLNDGKNHIGWTGQKHKTEFNPYGGSSYHKSSTKRKGEFKGYDKSGSFSRYFDLDKWAVSKGVKDTFPFLIVPKASKSEKNKGCENLDKGEVKHYTKNRRCKKCGYQQVSGSPCKCENPEWEIIERPVMKGGNIHPTVKPIKLMSYLITLGSREGDIIVDNFCGSGSTLVSAKELNRRFLGFDTEMKYVEISRARLSAVKQIQEKLL